MHFLKRSQSFVRFRVLGAFSFSPSEYEKYFLQNTFRNLSELSDEADESIGWVSPINCLQAPDLAEMMSEPYFKLAMRVDRRQISKPLLQAHRMIEEKAALQVSGKKKLSRQEKQDIKDGVEKMLLNNASETTNLYRALWNYKTATCSLFATSKAVQQKFTKLFSDTFSLDLEPISPWFQAYEWAKQNKCAVQLEDLEPIELQEESS